MRFQNYNQTANYDFTAMTYGTITRTGTGLADTTVRTAGGFAMRFEPTYSPNLMHWEQNVPTGNIQSKTMTDSLWVKINNSAYWAGTHTKPTLTFGEGCYSMTFGKACNNLMPPDNSTYGTINILGLITGGGSGMDLADNDPTSNVSL